MLALLAACAEPGEPELVLPLPAEVGGVWAAVQPEGLLELVEDPARLVPSEPGCLLVELAEGVETWTGGCALADGTVIEGRLTRYLGEDEAWVAGEAWSVWEDGRLALHLDGAVELVHDGELLLLDAASTTCGAHVDCADGLVALDLRYTILPGDLDLHTYDATVRGVVALEDREPAPVDGAWRADAATCPQEPLDGIFSVLLDHRHTLVLDGASACDACAGRVVQGVEAEAWCDAPLD